MSVIENRSVLRLRRLAAVACVFLSSAVVLAQSDGTKDVFQPRYPPGGKAGPREKVIRLQRELARLREEAPPVDTSHPHTEEIVKLARKAAESGRLSETLKEPGFLRFFIGTSPERLTLPPRQLNDLECHAAADLYGTLFELVRDDRQVRFGSKAVEYLKQYIKLAQMRKKVLTTLETEGISLRGDVVRDFRFADRHSLRILEYHKGFYCGHLSFFGGHGFTSFLLDPKGDFEHATVPLATRIVQDAIGRPETPYAAAEFVREVLRVLPHEGKLIESARDIPPPEFDRFGKEDREREKAEWEEFIEGAGRSITPPKREYTDAGETFAVCVYQSLGGSVTRYRLECDSPGLVQIREERIASWVGDCWGIK